MKTSVKKPSVTANSLVMINEKKDGMVNLTASFLSGFFLVPDKIPEFCDTYYFLACYAEVLWARHAFLPREECVTKTINKTVTEPCYVIFNGLSSKHE